MAALLGKHSASVEEVGGVNIKQTKHEDFLRQPPPDMGFSSNWCQRKHSLHEGIMLLTGVLQCVIHDHFYLLGVIKPIS